MSYYAKSVGNHCQFSVLICALCSNTEILKTQKSLLSIMLVAPVVCNAACIGIRPILNWSCNWEELCGWGIYTVVQKNCHHCHPSSFHYSFYTVNRKKHQNVFLIYGVQNLTDCNKIWYICWVNLLYRNVNVFCLIWIMSLLYLVKLSIRVLQVNGS